MAHTGPTPLGYRDVSMNLVGPDGIKTELQVNLTRVFMVGHAGGHELYEEIRALKEEIKRDRREATSDEKAKIDRAEEQSRKLYDAALDESR